MPPGEPPKLRDAPIAEGRTAELFAWGDGQILKLYHPAWSSQEAEYEARITRLVHASGLLVPAVGDLIEINGRAGLVFERADGPSLWDVSRRRPWMLFGPAPRLLATLHASLHRVTIPELPSQRERLTKRIRSSDLLPPGVKAQLPT